MSSDLYNQVFGGASPTPDTTKKLDAVRVERDILLQAARTTHVWLSKHPILWEDPHTIALGRVIKNAERNKKHE